MKLDKETLLKLIATIAIIIAMLGVIIGPSFWGDVFGIGGDLVRIIGCWTTILSIFFLIFVSVFQNSSFSFESGVKKIFGFILTLIGGLLICVALFGFFCFVNIVPGLPHDGNWNSIYGICSLVMFLGGGGSVGGGIIIIIISD